MINILITARYELKDKNFLKADTNDYFQIHELCSASFEKYLLDIDEHIVLAGIKDNYHEMLKDIFFRIKHIHLNCSCNILFADSDMMCIKPVSIFSNYDKFWMFCATPNDIYCKYPKSVNRKLYFHLKPWFMSNLRYYPRYMDSKVWDTGTELANNWIDVWAYECIIYNAMLHSQHDNLSNGYGYLKWKYHNPVLNYQYGIKGFKNDIPLGQAEIIHFGSSRGSKKVIAEMKKWQENT